MNDLSILYNEIGDQLIRYALSLTGEIHLAEDVVSETFLRATEHCVANDSLPSRAWFYKVARNLSFDWLRKSKRLDYNEPPDTDDTSVAANPQALLEHSEETSQLKLALSKLPESYRSVLILREFDDLSYVEIAAILGTNVNNVKVLLFRAKQKLKELYRRYE